MTRALAFIAGVVITAAAFLAGLAALVLFALADRDLDLDPEQCPSVLHPIGGYTGPPVRCQDFADHEGQHRHSNGDGIETTWEDAHA